MFFSVCVFIICMNLNGFDGLSVFSNEISRVFYICLGFGYPFGDAAGHPCQGYITESKMKDLHPTMPVTRKIGDGNVEMSG